MSIKNFIKFFENLSPDSKILRKNIQVGTRILTKGQYDNVDLEYKVGTILAIKGYGCILVEFDNKFSNKLHNAEGRGKDGQCFFILMENIISIDESKFKETVSEIKKRLDKIWKPGEIFIGDGIAEVTSPYDGKKHNLKVDGKIGVAFYESPGKQNLVWVGFLTKFDDKLLNWDNMGYPENKAGAHLKKINMRELTEGEKGELGEDIKKLTKMVSDYLTSYKKDDIVICNGKDSNYDISYKKNIGIVVSEYQKNYYIVKFLERFDENLYDVNYVCGNNNGSIVQKKNMSFAEQSDIEKNKVAIEKSNNELEEINKMYEVGDYVLTKEDIFNVPEFKNKIGKIIDINNVDRGPSHVQYIVEYSENFSGNYLRKIGKSKSNNCYSFIKRQLKLIDPELLAKLNRGELIPLHMSPKLDMVASRMNIDPDSFLTMSYFDITDKNDVVSYLPLDKMKRLESGEDPYKSRFRQQTKIGKFFGMLNKKLSQAEVEKFINEFKANYDLCISGIGDRLRLVSGEAVRFWYNEKSYVTGGGSLNSSCMKGNSKGPEMQMFVDNPDIIQLLILTNNENKLLGRSLIWKLSKPEGKFYMDYVYTRFDSDRKLLSVFGKEKGYIMGDGGSGIVPRDMECGVRTDKTYVMGRNALDHFDTFRRIKDGHTITL